jgi:DnaB helicase-like protein
VTTAHETPTNATDLAERALIGALLADPNRVRDVRDWLRPSDVNHPKARVIYQTLTELHRHGRTVPIRELPLVIAAGDGTHPTVTAQDLHAYVQATPAASQQLGTQHIRSSHVIYARRVLEAAARRIVAIAGSRIQEATEHCRDNPHLGAEDITATLAQTQQRLAALGQRLRQAQGSPGSLITAALGGPTHNTPGQQCAEVEPAEIRTGPPSGPLTIRVVIEAERELLTSCLTNPGLHAELAGWLTPTDFSRPEHAATWAALNALAQAGTPIDYVTLAWQCQRHNPDHNSLGLSADQLATMARHPPAPQTPRWPPSPMPPCCGTPTPPTSKSGPSPTTMPPMRSPWSPLPRRLTGPLGNTPADCPAPPQVRSPRHSIPPIRHPDSHHTGQPHHPQEPPTNHSVAAGNARPVIPAVSGTPKVTERLGPHQEESGVQPGDRAFPISRHAAGPRRRGVPTSIALDTRGVRPIP